jgi:DNA modification methylase
VTPREGHLKDATGQHFRPYPGGPLLEKERKVKHRQTKEKKRGGTKRRNAVVETTVPDTRPYEHRIYCGDAARVLQRFPDQCVDIIVTSPPYNFGQAYGSEALDVDDAVKWEEYFTQLKRVWRECVRVLKPGGRFCVNVQPLFSDYVPTHHIVSNQLRALGLLWKAEFLWEKHNYSCKYTAWGSWKSPSMPYIKYTWEFIEVFCKETHRKVGDASKIDITGDEFKAWVYAKWEVAPEGRMKRYGHPAMFPEALPTRLLKLFSYVDDLVLDPFNGAGTTTLVAEKLARRWIGIDVSEKYCRTAEQRIRNYHAQRKKGARASSDG